MGGLQSPNQQQMMAKQLQLQSSANMNTQQQQTSIDLSTQKDGSDPYSSRPSYALMFKSGATQDLLRRVVQSKVENVVYDPESTPALCREIATCIKGELKAQNYPRYKFLVQVIIGEVKGAGVRCGARCLWDQQTDKLAEYNFQNESLFCLAIAFGVYLY